MGKRNIAIQKYHANDYVQIGNAKHIITESKYQSNGNYWAYRTNINPHNWISQSEIELISSNRPDILELMAHDSVAINIIQCIPLIHNQESYEKLVTKAEYFLRKHGYELRERRGFTYADPEVYWDYHKRVPIGKASKGEEDFLSADDYKSFI